VRSRELNIGIMKTTHNIVLLLLYSSGEQDTGIMKMTHNIVLLLLYGSRERPAEKDAAADDTEKSRPRNGVHRPPSP